LERCVRRLGHDAFKEPHAPFFGLSGQDEVGSFVIERILNLAQGIGGHGLGVFHDDDGKVRMVFFHLAENLEDRLMIGHLIGIEHEGCGTGKDFSTDLDGGEAAKQRMAFTPAAVGRLAQRIDHLDFSAGLSQRAREVGEADRHIYNSCGEQVVTLDDQVGIYKGHARPG